MAAQRQAAKTFRDLLVWQNAHAFVWAVYKMTVAFPKREIDELKSQMGSAAVSIAADRGASQ